MSEVLTYGGRVRAARVAKGLKARDLAQRIGITPAWLSHIEHDDQQPGVHVAARIAEALGVDDLGEPCNREACAALRREVRDLRAVNDVALTSDNERLRAEVGRLRRENNKLYSLVSHVRGIADVLRMLDDPSFGFEGPAAPPTAEEGA